MYFVLLLYIIMAVLTYGAMFAYWQRKYPELADKDYYKDLWFSAVFSLVWPVTLPLSAFSLGLGHGLKFK